MSVNGRHLDSVRCNISTLILQVKKLGTKKFSNLPNIRNLGAMNQVSVLGLGVGQRGGGGEGLEREEGGKLQSGCKTDRQTDGQMNKYGALGHLVLTGVRPVFFSVLSVMSLRGAP